jgi:hypothetical protein
MPLHFVAVIFAGFEYFCMCVCVCVCVCVCYRISFAIYYRKIIAHAHTNDVPMYSMCYMKGRNKPELA